MEFPYVFRGIASAVNVIFQFAWVSQKIVTEARIVKRQKSIEHVVKSFNYSCIVI